MGVDEFEREVFHNFRVLLFKNKFIKHGWDIHPGAPPMVADAGELDREGFFN